MRLMVNELEILAAEVRDLARKLYEVFSASSKVPGSLKSYVEEAQSYLDKIREGDGD